MYSLKTDTIILSDDVKYFLDQLVSRLQFDIVVTSGTRTPRQQALAMFNKIDLGDDLIAIYKDDAFAQAIIDVYPNIDKATDIVAEYAANGGGSSHLRGLGVDIRSRDLTRAQIQAVVQVAEELGASTLVESTPPHIHIQVKKKPVNLKSLSIMGLLILGAIWTLK